VNGYLLDTHVLLWWLAEPARLPAETRDLIGSVENHVFLSVAAVWEMAIKKSIGRLDMPSNLTEVLEEERIRLLSIQASHALGVADLPFYHQDPFDRIQIVQARIEGLAMLTRDAQLAAYGPDVVPV